MSGGMMDKFKYFIGIGDEYTEEEYEDYSNYEVEDNYEEVNEAPKSKRVNNNVVNLHTNSNMKIIVHEPLSYDEAPVIVNDLKMRKTVVVNLEQLNNETKRQIFDFISGGLYSLEGNIQKVTTDIFVLAPSNVEIDGLKDEIKHKGIFSW